MVLLTLLAIAVGGFAAFCLMLVGLIETPWPILLGGLLLALYGLQRLSVQSQMLANQADLGKSSPALSEPSPTAKSPTAPPPVQPELMYRGIRYTPTGPSQSSVAPAATAPTESAGSQGAPWQRNKVKSAVKPGPVPELIYRGRKVRPSQGPEAKA